MAPVNPRNLQRKTVQRGGVSKNHVRTTRLRTIQDFENTRMRDIQVFMTTSPPSVSPLITVSMAILMWIFLLFVGLRYVLGTEVSSAWLIIGVMTTLAGLGLLLLIKEFLDAVVLPEPGDGRSHCEKAVSRPKSSAAFFRDRVDPSGMAHQRSALGLPPRQLKHNRRRVHAWFFGLCPR